MKVRVSTDNLQRALSFVNHAVSTKAQIAILSHILISTKETHITISATDLEIGIEALVLADIEIAGQITVPARTFFDLINSLPLEQITLEVVDTVLTVSSKKTKSTFQTAPASEFPKLYEERGEKVAIIPTATLRKDFGSVIFAASLDTARPALSGVLVQREEKGLLLVATDGYRLSLKHNSDTQTEQGSSIQPEKMIIPARVFREVVAAKETGEEIDMYIAREKNQVMFALKEAVLVGRLIEAEFPQYEKIIPSDFSARSTFDREELQKAVKICSIFAKDAANIIKLSLRTDKIIVSSQTPSLGQNTVEVDATLTGEENEIAFNAKYLHDVLANIDDDTLEFEMTGPLNPGVFRIKDDASFLHLIMPIRIQE